MATLLQTLKLTDDEDRLLSRMLSEAGKRAKDDKKHDLYYEALQKVEHLGIAVPPELRRFETVLNWPRVVIDEVERRLDVRTILVQGRRRSPKNLLAGWDFNNLGSRMSILRKETMIYGRGFATVGSNEDDLDHPLITVESSRQMVCLIDQRKRHMLAALRQYHDWDGSRKRTLYLPDATIHLVSGSGGWQVEARDDHNLGRVPVILYLNRPRAGEWWGTSEMSDVIPLTDSVTRALTNLQIAAEAHSVPTKYVLGVDKKDFIDARSGRQLDTWESYYTSMMAHASKDIKIGQLDATDLKNFHETVDMYGRLASSVSGLPLRYFGQVSVNPAAEGAIRAEEYRAVKNAERKQRDWGDCDAWLMALYERFRTGKWIDGSQIRIKWHDASTPTEAQRADSIVKLNGGEPVLSRQGSWDELGWDDARKEREQAYFEEEAAEGIMGRFRPLDPTSGELNDDPALSA